MLAVLPRTTKLVCQLPGSGDDHGRELIVNVVNRVEQLCAVRDQLLVGVLRLGKLALIAALGFDTLVLGSLQLLLQLLDLLAQNFDLVPLIGGLDKMVDVGSAVVGVAVPLLLDLFVRASPMLDLPLESSLTILKGDDLIGHGFHLAGVKVA